MRIAISADPYIPVPPENYGGIERIIGFLAEGLLARGHEVLLAAHVESKVKVPITPYPGTNFIFGGDLIPNMLTIKRLYDWKPDVIHSFSRLAYLMPLLARKIPKIMSYQREPTLSQIKKAVMLSQKGSLTFTGCSDYISAQISTLAATRTIYNGVDMATYTFREEVENDAPLVFLGRIEPVKGTHHAIETALKSGRKLIIAGNIPAEHKGYYDHYIKPYLNKEIEYIGEVNDKQKNELLGKAVAMLMPVEWNEPFGIVMCEAMACGTPVIGFSRGAVTEVIQHGYSGLLCRDTDGMIEAVQTIKGIKRQDVRAYCAERFSSDVIVEDYIRLYQSII